MLQINEPIKKFQEAYVRVQETKVSAHRIYSMLDEKSELENQPTTLQLTNSWSKIEYKNKMYYVNNGELIIALEEINQTIIDMVIAAPSHLERAGAVLF